jgi:hypothetical protein
MKTTAFVGPTLDTGQKCLYIGVIAVIMGELCFAVEKRIFCKSLVPRRAGRSTPHQTWRLAVNSVPCGGVMHL